MGKEEIDKKVLGILDRLESHTLGMSCKSVWLKIKQTDSEFDVTVQGVSVSLHRLIRARLVTRNAIGSVVFFKAHIPTIETGDQLCSSCSQGWDLGRVQDQYWHCPILGREVHVETGKTCKHFAWDRRKHTKNIEKSTDASS